MSEMFTTGVWSEGGAVTMRRSQDVTPYLDEVKALRHAGETGSATFRHAAKIPFGVIENYLATTGIDLHEFNVNPAHLKTMLNDPALAGFRIWSGRV